RGEVVHLVVQEKTCGTGGVRTVAVVERVGAGDGVADAIHDGEMSRVRAFAEADQVLCGRRVACGQAAGVRIAGLDTFARGGLLRVHGGENFLGVAGIGEPGDGNTGIVGVGQIGGAVREDAAHHFGNDVNTLDIVPALERNTFEHVQRFDD